ncbi:hypothetical protein NPIL_140551 [Nephila pilipes]|uniref:Uncharacterized protein n=1 Tax=Nephila pilipes TaxID=299642 RepID=A0A8X6T9G8_NEPPI|nr:hypothetical protein NPIL_140551 [Nephila pilipes]
MPPEKGGPRFQLDFIVQRVKRFRYLCSFHTILFLITFENLLPYVDMLKAGRRISIRIVLSSLTSPVNGGDSFLLERNRRFAVTFRVRILGLKRSDFILVGSESVSGPASPVPEVRDVLLGLIPSDKFLHHRIHCGR